MTRTVFLAWQDPRSRRWFPVGRLRSNGKRFVFVYTQGAVVAQVQSGFRPLAAFPDLNCIYQSDQLFPLFANRLMRSSRPDFAEFVEWLGLAESEIDPLIILGRSGGHRVTDSLEVFPLPERADGNFEAHFLVHGLSHMPPSSLERVERLETGETLYLLWDFQNPYDPEALALRTSESSPGDMFLVGYCPRYLGGELLKLTRASSGIKPYVTVAKVNRAPAPSQVRLLCHLSVEWPAGFEMFAGSEYQPLVKTKSRAMPLIA